MRCLAVLVNRGAGFQRSLERRGVRLPVLIFPLTSFLRTQESSAMQSVVARVLPTQELMQRLAMPVNRGAGFQRSLERRG